MSETGDTGVVYRGLTRVALEEAYSPSSMVGDIMPFIRRYGDESARARATHPRWTTERYGAGPAHTIDLFAPAISPSPLLLFIHGGYWQELSKAESCFPAPALTAAGAAFGALDYTLAPRASLDAIVDECRSAVAHLWRHRERLGITRLVIAGHSAGAHLAAMLMTSDRPSLGPEGDPIAGALLIGGVYDLEPIALTYVNDALGLDAAAVRRNSPLHLKPTGRVPAVVCWSQYDTDEFRRQSMDLADTWRPVLPDLVVFEQSRCHHFDGLFEWSDPASRLHRETMRLLGI